ncbi:MAG: hypothetical protein NTU41_13385 [Chloroflexi bacterium]|nr:hypothetical protein [Chloroflexota bacterium]
MSNKVSSFIAWWRARPLRVLILLIVLETLIFVILLGVLAWALLVR